MKMKEKIFNWLLTSLSILFMLVVVAVVISVFAGALTYLAHGFIFKGVVCLVVFCLIIGALVSFN